ncbi:MAG: 30S ribosomal protein S12 methylthiotransferase RimO [Nitrospinota bacterium]
MGVYRSLFPAMDTAVFGHRLIMHSIAGKRVYMVSLGCAKNRVDSEKTLYILARNGCTVTNTAENADVILINSCGFTNDARRETVETVLELSRLKEKNPGLKIAVIGCMVEILKEEMAAEMPEIDLLLPLSDASMSEVYSSDNEKRLVQPGAVSAYLKIAEGCANSCSFCSIPLIRGPLKSRPMDEILKEARALKDKGVKEICLVAQDTTRYGADLGIKDGLVKLLANIVKSGPEWIRVMYAYPALVTDDLLKIIAAEPSICPYFDVPFQHINDTILKSMGRRETGDSIKRLVDKIREKVPGAAIRSSFITGFPGEGQKEFKELEKFLDDYMLDHVGIFTFSPEVKTPSYALGDPVPDDEKNERKAILMETQRDVSRELNGQKVGKKFDALVEKYNESESLLTGRLQTQGPEVDGEVILDECEAGPGEIIIIEVTQAMEYDVIGKPASLAAMKSPGI